MQKVGIKTEKINFGEKGKMITNLKSATLKGCTEGSDHCVVCDDSGLSNSCVECEEGYYPGIVWIGLLENVVCNPCSDMSKCEDCNVRGGCDQCASGYLFIRIKLKHK